MSQSELIPPNEGPSPAEMTLMPRADGIERFRPLSATVNQALAQVSTLRILDTDPPAEQKRKSKEASRLRIDIFRASRLAAKKLHGELKEDVLTIGRALDKGEREIRLLCETAEEDLEEIENHAALKLAAEEDRLRRERTAAIGPYLTGPALVDFGKITQEEFDRSLADAKDLDGIRKERARKEQEDREARERAEAEERERVRLEEVRRREEAEAKARKAEEERQAMERQMETEREERRAAEAAAKAEQDRLKREADERERKAREEEQKRAAEEARIVEEARRKREAEAFATRETEKKRRDALQKERVTIMRTFRADAAAFDWTGFTDKKFAARAEEQRVLHEEGIARENAAKEEAEARCRLEEENLRRHAEEQRKQAAEEERARLAAAAPDKKKLFAYSRALSEVPGPSLSASNAKILGDIQTSIQELIFKINSAAENLGKRRPRA